MKEAEFRKKFDAYWLKHYAAYDATDKNHYTLIKEGRERSQDAMRRIPLLLTLLHYAADCRIVGVSRKKNNLSQRIFNELSVNPLEIEFSASTRRLIKIQEEKV